MTNPCQRCLKEAFELENNKKVYCNNCQKAKMHEYYVKQKAYWKAHPEVYQKYLDKGKKYRMQHYHEIKKKNPEEYQKLLAYFRAHNKDKDKNLRLTNPEKFKKRQEQKRRYEEKRKIRRKEARKQREKETKPEIEKEEQDETFIDPEIYKNLDKVG